LHQNFKTERAFILTTKPFVTVCKCKTNPFLYLNKKPPELISEGREYKNGFPYWSLQYIPESLNLCDGLKEGNADEIICRKYKSGKQRNSFTEIVGSKLQKM
jgi:hypothetical protein